MSISEIQRFAVEIQSDTALRAEAERHSRSSPALSLDAVAAFAATRGYGFTAGELKEQVEARAQAGGRELGEAELDRVVGGLMGLQGLVGLMKWMATQFGAPADFGTIKW